MSQPRQPGAPAERIRSLRNLMRFLDEAFRVPGTNFRFGWDPIIGLIPWIGDALTALISLAIVFQANRMRIPKVVQLRMLLNIGIDVLVGVVPFVGDVADVFWKSNAKNFALLERHEHEIQPPTHGDWLFVVGIFVAIAAIIVVPLIVLYALVQLMMARAS